MAASCVQPITRGASVARCCFNTNLFLIINYGIFGAMRYTMFPNTGTAPGLLSRITRSKYYPVPTLLDLTKWVLVCPTWYGKTKFVLSLVDGWMRNSVQAVLVRFKCRTSDVCGKRWFCYYYEQNNNYLFNKKRKTFSHEFYFPSGS
jgi:hypothetical protein